MHIIKFKVVNTKFSVLSLLDSIKETYYVLLQICCVIEKV